MKKLLLLSVIALFSMSLLAQNRAVLNSNVAKVAVKKPYKVTEDGMSTNQSSIPYANHTKVVYEEEIGQTQYDLMTNSTCDHRIYRYDDGTMGATFTFGSAPSSFPERGTGYQYFDGTAWLGLPTSRIETIRTGWPSYSHLGVGNTGECVVSHNGTTLVLSKRTTKGTGAWSQSLMPVTGGATPTWPRICTVGDNIYALSASNTAFGGQTYPLFFSRSTDAGATWDIQNVIPAGLTPADGYIEGFGGDVYDWAEPVGNTIAFVVGDNWTDLVLMKSTDGGTTWNKTIIFQHPYPSFNEATMLTDTFYTCDGAHAVALDAAGNAYVAFGVMNVINDDTTDGNTSYFPFTDGLAFWKEGDATITDMNPDSLYNSGHLIGWLEDVDGSGVVMDNLTDVTTQIPLYYLSCTSMPQLSIDANGDIYCVYKSFVETMQSGAGQFYSHLYGKASFDGGLTWCNSMEITSGPDHELVECIFPSLSMTSDSALYLTYMSDFEPGLNIRGDADPAGSNSIMFNSIPKGDFPFCMKVQESKLFGEMVSVYPNPVADYMNVDFSFNKSTKVTMNIYNAVGSLVKSESFVTERGQSTVVNTKDLSSGIYLIKFETANGTFNKKIIRN